MAVIVETLMAEDMERGTGSTSKTHPGGGTLNGNQINLGVFSTVGPGVAAPSTTWDPGSIASGASEEKEITVSGAALGDFVLVSFSLDVQGLSLTADVTAVNTVTAVLSNLSGGAVNLSSGTLRVLVFKVT